MLDEFHGLLKQTRTNDHEMGKEIKNQITLTSKISTEVILLIIHKIDTVENKIQKAKNRLNHYVEKSSNSCLMTIICVEVFIALVILLGFN